MHETAADSNKAPHPQMALQDCSGNVHMTAAGWGLQKHTDDFADFPCFGLQTETTE